MKRFWTWKEDVFILKNQFEKWFNDNAPNLNREDALYALNYIGVQEPMKTYERWRKEYMKVRNIR